MQILQSIGGLIGGLGIFLLAMKLMTDGLKLAGGDALKDILGRWTSTPLRGLVSGIAITAFVQSSSAVTVATIGFVNAGLMNLYQAIGVIFGANAGTTMTAWLVAALGFEVDVAAFALPMIGAGMGLWFMRPATRLGAVGQALGGFGLFFVGIDTLNATFEGLASGVNLQAVSEFGLAGVAMMVGAGFMLTMLTQSSSAAIAITLTAATGGVIALPSACAMIVGANVGTTSTAFFAALNATPNAKRVATAHVVFNAATGVVALLIMPAILFLIAQTSGIFGLNETPAVALALFHTIFNVLGVILMWPFLGRLALWLAGLFRTDEEQDSQPRFIDRTVAVTPALALNALMLEVNRIGGLARQAALSALSGNEGSAQFAHAKRESVDALDLKVGEFASDLQKSSLQANEARTLPKILRLSHYYTETAELMSALTDFPELLEHIGDQDLRSDARSMFKDIGDWLERSDPQSAAFVPESFESRYDELDETYHQLKDRLLRAGLSQKVPVRDLGHLLDRLSALNRALKRFHKAMRLQATLVESRSDLQALEPAPLLDD